MKQHQNVSLVHSHLLLSGAAEGQKLPTERALVVALGMSRNTVRNALAALEADGHIVRKVGSGTYLAPRMRPESSNFNVNPKQIIEARFALEPSLASIAAMNCNNEDLEALAECARRYHEANNFEAFEEADAGYHQAIATASHNPVLVRAYQGFTFAHEAVEWGNLRQRLLNAERRVASRAEHDKILNAIRDRDAQGAAGAMREHLHLIASVFLHP